MCVGGVIGLLVNVDQVVAELHERLEFPFLEVKLDIVVDCKKYQKHLKHWWNCSTPCRDRGVAARVTCPCHGVCLGRVL